jgi:DNA-binding MarR family transcriptional regulator
MATGTATPVGGMDANLGYWLRFVSNHVAHAFRLKIEARGVTMSEWAVLRELHRLGTTSPGVLAGALGLSKGAVSKLVDRLVAKALVDRSVTEEDRRQQALVLTRTGRTLVPVLGRLAARNDAECFGHLPAGLPWHLMELMREIVRHHGWQEVPLQ